MDIIKNIKIVNNDKAKYRLGDAVLLQNGANTDFKGVRNEKYKGSIGYEYCSRTKEKLQMEIMQELIEKKILEKKYEMPGDSEVVIHLRIGENRHHGTKKSKTIENSKEIEVIVDLIRPEAELVTIVTAMHQIENPAASEYTVLQTLYDKLAKKGFPVKVKSSDDIDEDFCYLSRAKTLIVTHGNFSLLAGFCNPNQVHWDLCSRDFSTLDAYKVDYKRYL